MLVFKLKVSLLGNEEIYRIIEIIGNQTLNDLHKIIFEAFDRFDEHLYSFYLTRGKISNIRDVRKYPEYSHPMLLEESLIYGKSKEKFNTEETEIDSLKLKENDRLYYIFDYGDQWWHEIEIISIRNEENPKGYPKVVYAAGESPKQYPPPEDKDY